MEIPLLDSTPREWGEQCAGLGTSFIQLQFLRDAIRPEIWMRKKVETGSWQRWRKEAKKERQREDEGGERKRVDNSQDRIVPRAKNRSIPKCYRMAETLASRVLLRTLLLKIPLRENCFIRAAYTWQYQLLHLDSLDKDHSINPLTLKIIFTN